LDFLCFGYSVWMRYAPCLVPNQIQFPLNYHSILYWDRTATSIIVLQSQCTIPSIDPYYLSLSAFPHFSNNQFPMLQLQNINWNEFA
jgi:hypothetical protein